MERKSTNGRRVASRRSSLTSVGRRDVDGGLSDVKLLIRSLVFYEVSFDSSSSTLIGGKSCKKDLGVRY